MTQGRPLDFFDSTFLRKLETLAIFTRRAFAGRLRGEQRSNRHGSSVEFADFRPYSQGDDFRRIDWNAFARFENLFLKLFVEEEDLFVYLLVDCSASMGFGAPTTKFDLARRTAAAMAYIALAHLDRVALFALAHDAPGEAPPQGQGGDRAADASSAARAATSPSDHLAFVRGKGAIFSVFDFLRGLQPAGRTDLAASVRDFVLRQRRKGVVILISDLLSPTGYEEPIRQLALAGFQPMVIHTLTPEELEPDIAGDFRLIDSETGQALDISTTRVLVETYRKRVERFTRGVDQFCAGHNVACLRTTTEVDFEELILRTLRRAAVLR